ncbi:Adenylate kinase [Nitrospira sp. KM1]|uniref:adenylate kinase n=1 Tax=Nitrospira sp. KM1 TaxID=1936990 RepID=UPI0013A724B7|nr:adenylate kinase [Nitrospira sp. KM1]BCA56746.1 Adenylate kinase [Nitrospira sp. KM1]
MRVVFLGAPGVGKGTQADRIAAQFKVLKISTGDLLREAVRNQTALGIEAKNFMDQGKLVPDSVVIGLVRNKLADPSSAKGFVLDGFPRTVLQAEELGKALKAAQAPLDRVVNFEVSREDIIKRLSGRRSCPKCQATFHVEFAPSKTGHTCDRCGEVLVQRNDDKPEAIETRLKVYEEQTAPLIKYYGNQRLLSQLNASGSVDTVFEALFGVLAPYTKI